jgi:hypothetical protein
MVPCFSDKSALTTLVATLYYHQQRHLPEAAASVESEGIALNPLFNYRRCRLMGGVHFPPLSEIARVSARMILLTYVQTKQCETDALRLSMKFHQHTRGFIRISGDCTQPCCTLRNV